MSAADRPLRYDDLINLIFENCNVNYVEFQIALGHLEEINHITKLHDDHSCDVFVLEAPGKEAIKYLEKNPKKMLIDIPAMMNLSVEGQKKILYKF